jgi:hypothetical protein
MSHQTKCQNTVVFDFLADSLNRGALKYGGCYGFSLRFTAPAATTRPAAMAASAQALPLLMPVSGAAASGVALTTAPVTASTKPVTISNTPTALLDGLNFIVSLSWLVALVRRVGVQFPRCEVSCIAFA